MDITVSVPGEPYVRVLLFLVIAYGWAFDIDEVVRVVGWMLIGWVCFIICWLGYHLYKHGALL